MKTTDKDYREEKLMKKSNRLYQWLQVMAGTLLLFAALAVGLSADAFSIVSHAESAGKVTASSANIRKEPSTSSETLASTSQGAALNVKGQTTGSDGYTWYQVSDGSVTGYIRSDLMEITDGSTPSTIVTPTSPSTTSTPTTSTPDEPLVDVTDVEPVSGSVSGGSQVRVRQNASTTSRIVSTARSGLAVTVTGTATGTDGEQWRRVSFISGSSEVTGFIRADYVTVSGDLVPVGAGGTEQPEGGQEPSVEPEPEEVKDWDTYYEGEKWHLLDNTTGNTWDIAQIFSINVENANTLKAMLNKNRTQQIIIIILVILLMVMAIGISFLIFKLKDMTDSAYFNEVERETVRRRTADRPAERTAGRTQGGQRVMQTMGERRPSGQGQAGQRPAGSQAARPGGSTQRPAGQRPTEQRAAGTQTARPGGSMQRPAGQRPAGSQTGRPGDSTQRPVSQRPAGSQTGRPDDSAQRPVGQRPAEQRSTDQRPAGAQPAQRPANRQSDYASDYDYNSDYEQEAPVQEAAPAQPQKKTGWKAKNFINDDEFEFQFLDWEDDQK
ncbi:MAG: SH3 domain-containing protein [Acetatifactor sp.]|nr:SH3 domain-containing protein [Acetatifactor sp.]